MTSLKTNGYWASTIKKRMTICICCNINETEKSFCKECLAKTPLISCAECDCPPKLTSIFCKECLAKTPLISCAECDSPPKLTLISSPELLPIKKSHYDYLNAILKSECTLQ
jgi:hypothetical protein